MAELKEREQKILDYMKEEIRTKGYPPTVREICAALGIRSTSTAHKDIENLVRHGYLVKDPSKPRALMVVDPSEDQGHTSYAGGPARHDIVDIPIVGRVAAGTPILAEQNIEDSFPLPARYAASGTNYMLKVRGESMIEAGIRDSDLVYIHIQPEVEDGQIAAVRIGDEATLKRVYYDGESLTLQPCNSAYRARTYRGQELENIRIEGKAVGFFQWF